MNDINYIRLEETDSTNSYIASHIDSLQDATVVCAFSQTAGRGQRGNSWESEPGKNITMSILLKNPNILPSHQFEISEACALAVANALGKYTQGITIKWPNDIYYHDCKICGILIEHSLSGGKISHTIAGIGLNVNQRHFFSDAPNPISLANIIGNETPLETIIKDIANGYFSMCQALPEESERIHKFFLKNLYRINGSYPYRTNIDSVSIDNTETIPAGTVFNAEIIDIEPNGTIMLKTNTAIHAFTFKEISFVLPSATV